MAARTKPAEDDAPALSFRDWLVERQERVEGRRKGERTRDRIKVATVDLLNEKGYLDLRVSDVCERAKITAPVLYLYFESKQALVENLLREFLDQFAVQRTRPPERSAFDSIFQANLRWLLWAKANSGLVQCLFEFSDEIPEFGSLYAKANHEWHLRTARAIMRRFPPAEASLPVLHFQIVALGGMMDDITRRLYSRPDSYTVELARRVAPDDETLALLLTKLWYRSLYGTDHA